MNVKIQFINVSEPLHASQFMKKGFEEISIP